MKHALTGREPGLVGYFPFDEGMGFYRVRDLSSYATHGTPTYVPADAAPRGMPVGTAADRMWIKVNLKQEPPEPVTSGSGGKPSPGGGEKPRIEELEKDVAAKTKQIADLEDKRRKCTDCETERSKQAKRLPELEAELKKSWKPEPGQQRVLSLEGGGGAVDIGKRPEHKIPRELTLEAWICPSSQHRYASIVSRVYDTKDIESGYGLMLNGDGGILCALKTVGAAADSLYHSTGPGPLTMNEWSHVAATYDGKQIIIYINGEPRKTVPCSGENDYDPDQAMNIGSFKGGYKVPGKLAQIRVWGLARSPEEIKSAMRATLRGNETGLVGYWPLNEESGDTVRDYTKNGAHGNVPGATFVKP